MSKRSFLLTWPSLPWLPWIPFASFISSSRNLKKLKLFFLKQFQHARELLLKVCSWFFFWIFLFFFPWKTWNAWIGSASKIPVFVRNINLEKQWVLHLHLHLFLFLPFPFLLPLLVIYKSRYNSIQTFKKYIFQHTLCTVIW